MGLFLRSTRAVQKLSTLNKAASYSSHAPVKVVSPIGNREVVGFGFNGEPNYIDRVDFPMPAIRFKSPTPDIQTLREKEKGDWKKLSIEEKRQLYRASFCQTFAEMDAPTGEWKSIVGCSLALVAASLWMFMAMKVFVYTEYPESFSTENKQAQMQRMIDIAVNPIEGLASKWDYEKGDWKK